MVVESGMRCACLAGVTVALLLLRSACLAGVTAALLRLRCLQACCPRAVATPGCPYLAMTLPSAPAPALPFVRSAERPRHGQRR